MNVVSLLASFGKVCFQIGSQLPDTKHKTGYGLPLVILWQKAQGLPEENTRFCSAFIWIMQVVVRPATCCDPVPSLLTFSVAILIHCKWKPQNNCTITLMISGACFLHQRGETLQAKTFLFHAPLSFSLFIKCINLEDSQKIQTISSYWINVCLQI